MLPKVTWPIPFACDCGTAIWRTVFGTEQLQNRGQRVIVCMRCGRVGAVCHTTQSVEGSDAVRVVGVEALKAAPAELAWLGAWPRRVGDPEGFYTRSEDVFFLPATALFESELELEQAEVQSRREAVAKRFDERLRAAGIPREPPPETSLVRHTFWFFVEAWEAVRFPADTSIETILHRADPLRRPASWVAEAHLPMGEGLVRSVASLVGDPDATRRRVGLMALNLLKSRTVGDFALPDAVLDAAAACIARLDPSDDSRRYLIHVLGLFDRRAIELLLREVTT
jgi:hypothetical protein